MIKLGSTVSLALFLLGAGCSSSSSDVTDHDLGTVKVDAYQIQVVQEGSFRPGNTTKWAFKATGAAKPDAIMCWLGAQANAPHVATVYDSGDDDFDCIITMPSSASATDTLFFTVTAGGKTTMGQVTPDPS